MSSSSKAHLITRTTCISMALRSLLLEASWNYRGMQNLGFCFAILPALKKLYSGDALKEAAKRHLSFCNTNPCFSAFVLGSVVAEEAQCSCNESADRSRLDRMKSFLGGAFGALGDDLMWASLKPALGTLAVLLFLLGQVWAFVWLVGIFSMFSVSLRFIGIRLGMEGRLAVEQYLRQTRPRRASTMLKRATAVLLGATAGVLLSGSARSQMVFAGRDGLWFGGAVISAIILACFILRSKNVPSGRIGVGICFLVLIVALLA